jgi:glycerophosphoryl diester phosphodiesterase
MRLIALLSLWILACSAFAAENSEPAFLDNGVTAHRGNSGEFPENTLPAFKSAMELGVDWIELDIYRAKSGELVVTHDHTTQRVSDRNLKVTDSTYEELLTADVAADFRKRTGKTLSACPPQRMPLLQDVLDLVIRQNSTRVSIQPKMDCVAEAIALVKQKKAERWVGFNDGNLQLMSKVKRLAPEIPVFWDRGPKTNIDEDIAIASQNGFETLVLEQSGVSAKKVRKIRAAGFKVGAWTVNDRSTMEKFLDLGIERLYTDFPRTLLALKKDRPLAGVTCEGVYPRHLQGVCTDGTAIYWSFTTFLVKTDLKGTLLKQIPVASHHGDLCQQAGKLYVAVNLGKFNDPQGKADSWVYIYDSETLEELARHEIQQVFHGAGGIDIHDGHFFVVGGLPERVEENYVYEYDGQFHFVKKHVIPSGHTHLGIQTAAFADGRWWFGCYGSPKILLVTSPDFKMIGRYEFDGSLGIDDLPDGQLLVAEGRCQKGTGCTGNVGVAVPDDRTGLRFQDNGEKTE